jgi:hypothetical protein
MLNIILLILLLILLFSIINSITICNLFLLGVNKYDLRCANKPPSRLIFRFKNQLIFSIMCTKLFSFFLYCALVYLFKQYE